MCATLRQASNIAILISSKGVQGIKCAHNHYLLYGSCTDSGASDSLSRVGFMRKVASIVARYPEPPPSR